MNDTISVYSVVTGVLSKVKVREGRKVMGLVGLSDGRVVGSWDDGVVDIFDVGGRVKKGPGGPGIEGCAEGGVEAVQRYRVGRNSEVTVERMTGFGGWFITFPDSKGGDEGRVRVDAGFLSDDDVRSMVSGDVHFVTVGRGGNGGDDDDDDDEEGRDGVYEVVIMEDGSGWVYGVKEQGWRAVEFRVGGGEGKVVEGKGIGGCVVVGEIRGGGLRAAGWNA